MKLSLFSAALCAAVSISAGAAFAQGVQEETSATNQAEYPMAAPAGVDSHADMKAPAGAVNTGPFNDKTWKFGPRTNAPAGGSPIWNPVMIKMKAGQKVTSATAFSTTSPATYCALANAGYDFIWTEMQHDGHTWQDVQNMWAACPHAKAVPGARVPNANEFDEQHALDEGALVLIIPTVRSLAEGKEGAKWAFWPPMGQRSSGGGQGSSGAFWGQVPGGYRETMNDNLVLIEMIETLDGLKDADKIAKIPGVSALMAASSDLGNFSGYRAGDPDYEREINIVHDATLRAHIRLCGPFQWVNRPDFTCFQGPGSDRADATGDLNAYYANAAKASLGVLWNTQGVPKVGPYAPGWTPPAAPARARRAAPVPTR